MSRRLVVDVFVEDHAHEALLLAMLRRLGASEDCQVQPRIRSARGGHGRAIDEMRRVQEIRNIEGLHRQDRAEVEIAVREDRDGIGKAVRPEQVENGLDVGFMGPP